MLPAKRSQTVRSSSRINPKTPSTMERTAINKSHGSGDQGDDAYTPEQFKATASITGMTTDEQGNRLSILPGSSRPSKARVASMEKNKSIASFADSSAQEESKKPKKSHLE